MLSTKKDIDRQVRTHLAKLRTDNEKSLRGYIIARLYYKIGEYAVALNYLNSYLSAKSDAKSDCANAHKLQGQCLEKLNKSNEAFVAYQRSLHINPKQSDLLIEVCKYLLKIDLTTTNNGVAQHWCNIAQTENINHESILDLKLKLIECGKTGGNNSLMNNNYNIDSDINKVSTNNNNNNNNIDTKQQVENLLKKEINNKPHDCNLRIRLLRFYFDNINIFGAFKYAFDLEMKNFLTTSLSVDWYNEVLLILTAYENNDEHTKDWDYWLLKIIVLEKLVNFNLCKIKQFNYTGSLNDSVQVLFQFDQSLSQATENIEKLCTERNEITSEFLNHYRGQLCLHAATLIFHQELLTNKNRWYETKKNAIPLLLLAYNFGTPNIEKPWFQHCTDVKQKLLIKWKQQAAFRCVQVGRTLLSCIDKVNTKKLSVDHNNFKHNIRQSNNMNWTTSDELINQIRKICSDVDWRNNLYRIIFNNIDYISNSSTSYFIKCSEFIEPKRYELPTIQELQTYVDIAQNYEPYNLQLLIYLTVDGNDDDNKINNYPKTKELKFSISNLMNCTADTLNQLDIEAFFSAGIIQAKRTLDIDQYNYETSIYNQQTNKPIILPFANIYDELCSEEQQNWWLLAYKSYKNIEQYDITINELRTTIQYGIETVRGIGSPKMDIYFYLKLGEIFQIRSNDQLKPIETDFLLMRAKSLYKCGLNMLKMQNNNRHIEPHRRLFKYKQLYDNYRYELDINRMAEEGIQFLAGQYFKNDEFEEFIDDFGYIALPFATYLQAEAYRKLLDSDKTPKKNRQIFTAKVKECLNRTLTLLDQPHIDKNHPLKSIINSDIKRLQYSTDDVGATTATTTMHILSNTPITSTQTQREFNSELENLMKKMMDTLSLVKIDMDTVKNDVGNVKHEFDEIRLKLNGIENQLLKKQPEPSTIDVNDVPLDDLYEFNDNSPFFSGGNNINFNNHMNVPRLLPQQLPLHFQQNQSQRIHSPGLQQQQYLNRNALYHNNLVFGGPGDDTVASGIQTPPYNQIQQQQQHQQHQQYQQQQQQQHYLPHLYGHGIPLQSMVAMPPPLLPPMNFAMSSPSQLQPTHHQQPQQEPQRQPIQLQQQSSLHIPVTTSAPMLFLKDYPVEKTLPVNVVITSSDPLPIYTTVTSQPTLIVNIPIQHIKHNNNNNTNNNNSSNKSNNTPITGELDNFGDKHDSIIKEKNSITVTTSSTTTIPAFQSNLFSSTPFASPVHTVVDKSTKEAVLTKSSNAFAGFSYAGSATVPSATKPCAVTSTTVTTAITIDSTKDLNPTKPNPFDSFTFSSNNKDKPSTFGNFSFGSITTPAITTTIQNTLAISTTTITSTVSSFTTSGNPGNVSSSNTMFNHFNNVAPIETATTTVIKANTSETDKNQSVNAAVSTEEDDYVPTAQFQPVIPLPDIIDVKTGEENETILFEQRAKLLRFVKETKEWKERGLGNMKILVQTNNSNKVRMLMRREQVLKLCCNQFVTKDTKFTKMPNTETALTWYGQDFSENALQTELLAIRFKTAEICKQFHDTILDAQKNMIASDQIGSSKDNEKNTVTIDNKKGFGDQFKPKVGSWNCAYCYVTNKPDSLNCIACNSLKDNNQSTKLIDDGNNADDSKTPFTFKFQQSNKINEKVPQQQPEINKNNFTFGGKPTNPITTTSDKKDTLGFGDQFKPKAGSWTCQACYISNICENLYCLACDSPKDDTVPKKDPFKSSINLSTGNSSAPKFTFGLTSVPPLTSITSSTAAVSTTTQNSSTASSGGFVFGNSSDKLIFGNKTTVEPVTTTTTTTNTIATTTSFQQPNTFNFNMKATNPKDEEDLSIQSSVSAAQMQLETKESFGFVFKPKSPLKVKTPVKNTSTYEDITDDENIEEENNTYFTPAIPLPEKIEVKTGEENEYVLYSHRAKLYRFDNGEWKERGLGDVKVLKNKENGKLRVIMRREQILKICLNHYLTEDILYVSKDDKSWLFVVNDFSDNEVVTTRFCLRFKTPEIAMEFKGAIDAAIDNSLSQIANIDLKSQINNNNISDEDKKKMLELQLNEDFFSYNCAPECVGCRGCTDDSFEFQNNNNVNSDIADNNPLPLQIPQHLLANISDLNMCSPYAYENEFETMPTTSPNQLSKIKTEFNLFLNSTNDKNVSLTNRKCLFTENSFTKSPEKSIFGQTASSEMDNIFTVTTNVTTTTSSFVFGSSSNSFVFGSGLNQVKGVNNQVPETNTSIFSFNPTTPYNFSFTPQIGISSSTISTTTLTSQSTATSETTVTKSSFALSPPNTHAPLEIQNSEITNENNNDKVAKSLTFNFEEAMKQNEIQPATNRLTSFVDLVKSINTDTNNGVGDTNLFTFDSNMTFETLAKNAPATLVTNSNELKNDSNKSGSFFGLSQKEDFSNFLRPLLPETINNNTSGGAISNGKEDGGGDGGGGANTADDENYDPHYDPIIALPAEITVTTGEEGEQKLFGERATLFRYDATNKEWKERGVGEMKILHHLTNNTYRFLMRREQIFKCVLNHTISSNFNMQPMSTSGRAFCWATKNFAEEQPTVEQLSIRFKKAETAEAFKLIVDNCVAQLESRGDLEPEDD